MPIKVAINGYGRIGRNIMRAIYESGRQDEIQVVAHDACDGDVSSTARILSVSSKITPGVPYSGDAVCLDAKSVKGGGNAYQLTVRVQDRAGNATDQTFTVSVPATKKPADRCEPSATVEYVGPNETCPGDGLAITPI